MAERMLQEFLSTRVLGARSLEGLAMIKNNRQLQQEVLEELKFVLGDDAAGICVTATDGVVQPTGHVSDDSEKSEAANAVLRVDGVRGVADEVRIEPSAEQLPTTKRSPPMR